MVYKYIKLGIFKKAQLTGSFYICNPPVLNTDIDFICFTTDLADTKELLLLDGWELCGAGQYTEDNHWFACRKDEYNFIITNNNVYYERFVLATQVAKKLNLKNKVDRIKLFQFFNELP